MNWFAYALACAFFTASSDALVKLAMRETDEYAAIWFRLVFSLPLLFLFMLSYPIPKLDAKFWLAIMIMLPLEAAACILYFKSVRNFDLSEVMPFLGFTPVFSIFIALLVLGEKPSFLGILGIASVFGGAYLLNIHTAKEGILRPIKEALRNKGTRSVLIVAFIYAITSTFGKFALLRSSLHSFPFIYFSFLFIVMTVILSYRVKAGLSKIELPKKQVLLYIVLGIVFALAAITHYKAIALTEVSYMISVKRLSLLLGVLYGGLIFKEKNIHVRFAGASFMVLGAILLSFA